MRAARRRPMAPATNLVHAVENLADHLTHFYLFFMPDFARATYAAEPWHEAAAARFTAMKGTARRRCCPRAPG
jgi:hydrogenase large subunit